MAEASWRAPAPRRRAVPSTTTPPPAAPRRAPTGRRRIRPGQGQVRRQERRRQGQLHEQRQVRAHGRAGRRQGRPRHGTAPPARATGAAAAGVARHRASRPRPPPSTSAPRWAATARPAAWSRTAPAPYRRGASTAAATAAGTAATTSDDADVHDHEPPPRVLPPRPRPPLETAAEKTKDVARAAAEKTESRRHRGREDQGIAPPPPTRPTALAATMAGKTETRPPTRADKTDAAARKTAPPVRHRHHHQGEGRPGQGARTGIARHPRRDREGRRDAERLRQFEGRGRQGREVAKGVDGVTNVKSAIKVK